MLPTHRCVSQIVCLLAALRPARHQSTMADKLVRCTLTTKDVWRPLLCKPSSCPPLSWRARIMSRAVMKPLFCMQFLESYKSVTVDSMAQSFGVTPDFIDRELVDFIVAGRLTAKIDKVAGVIETNRSGLSHKLDLSVFEESRGPAAPVQYWVMSCHYSCVNDCWLASTLLHQPSNLSARAMPACNISCHSMHSLACYCLCLLLAMSY